MNIQEEIQKIHHQYGISEMANYQIELLINKAIAEHDEYNLILENTEKELSLKLFELLLMVQKPDEEGGYDLFVHDLFEQTLNKLKEAVAKETIAEHERKQWHKYPDEKPEIGQVILWQCKDGFMLTREWFGEGSLSKELADDFSIAWRELPASYQQTAQEGGE